MRAPKLSPDILGRAPPPDGARLLVGLEPTTMAPAYQS